jgi:tetratricopeptide (TPR) repeat protein
MRRWCDEALELARRSHDHVAEGIFVNQLALAEAGYGHHERAGALLEESVRLLEDDPYARYPLANVGLEALRTGDAQRAAAIFAEVLEMDRSSGDDHHLSGVAAWLALAVAIEGREGEAKPHARESLETVAELAADEAAAMALLVAARIASACKPNDAATTIGSVDGILERAGAQRREMVPGMYESMKRELEEQLGPELFVEAYQRGRSLMLEDAVRVGLASLD